VENGDMKVPSILKIRIAIVCYFVYYIPFMINCTVLIYREKENTFTRNNNQQSKREKKARLTAVTGIS